MQARICPGWAIYHARTEHQVIHLRVFGRTLGQLHVNVSRWGIGGVLEADIERTVDYARNPSEIVVTGQRRLPVEEKPT
jgi:hypothetical protein